MKEPLLWPMNVGRDGHRYPGVRLTPGERATLAYVVHHLRHVCGFTHVEISEYLEARGAPLSTTSVSRYLAQPCERCPDHDHQASAPADATSWD